jgi:hypothetical protein
VTAYHSFIRSPKTFASYQIVLVVYCGAEAIGRMLFDDGGRGKNCFFRASAYTFPSLIENPKVWFFGFFPIKGGVI